MSISETGRLGGVIFLVSNLKRVDKKELFFKRVSVNNPEHKEGEPVKMELTVAEVRELINADHQQSENFFEMISENLDEKKRRRADLFPKLKMRKPLWPYSGLT